MKSILIIAGCIAGILITFSAFGFKNVIREDNAGDTTRFERVSVLYTKFERGEPISQADVLPFAKDPRTREITFQLLAERNKSGLFPQEYNTIVKAAESNLANWLEYPTELNAIPDEIEHLKRVTIDFDGQGHFVHYEVFRYRTFEPHWAAKDSWILGVVGPYFDDSKPYDFPSSTFSRISSTEASTTPEEEVKWVHENISLRQ